ncbi:Helix-turn-helix domain [Mycobacteroides abscessus subsp. abscessus]|uniref:helix-turn-helix domain-containing protein n=1 Tax=Mycobacteroides abscessus TaxID=36809 RepID=UPI00092A9F4B|nr:helix-turn-helix domain-containing protein [Mycobacteroides abscessus]SIC55187.1 Helix-turn-helix domain [Mycobacteroides abscessus subsp. abscessus]SKU58441.1 Helix-turn-helix domain [Mycobacteroides abscessus subsp. abscessus]
MNESTRPVGALSTIDAAAYLGISRDTIDREKNAGRICPRYIGRKPIYPIEELQRYLADLPSEPEPRS